MRWPRGPTNELHMAAGTGSVNAVTPLLSTVNINQGDPTGCTPLHFAATLGFSRVVKLLLNKGANVSIPNDEGFTALISSAQQGHLVVCKMLVGAGADIEAANDQGSTPLYLAATRGHREIVEALIEAGANVDCRRVGGTTPLYSAAERGHVGIVKLLLQAKASPLLPSTDSSGATWIPLDAAVATGHPEVAYELIRQHGIDGCGGPSRGVDALCLAVQFQPDHDVLTKLMDAGVVDTGEALLRAADCGHEASMKLLLQRATGGRAHLNKIRNPEGVTPLLFAAGVGTNPSPRIARLLVDAGADVSSVVQLMKQGRVVGRDVPLGYALFSLRVKMLGGQGATEKQLQRLEGARRLLMRVDAVYATSWLWISDAPRPQVAAAAEGAKKPTTKSTSLTVVLPMLRRRAAKRGMLLAALFRWVVGLAKTRSVTMLAAWCIVQALYLVICCPVLVLCIVVALLILLGNGLGPVPTIHLGLIGPSSIRTGCFVLLPNSYLLFEQQQQR